MADRKLGRDFQTFNIFIILVVMTLLFVVGLKAVLFVPWPKNGVSGVTSPQEESAQR